MIFSPLLRPAATAAVPEAARKIDQTLQAVWKKEGVQPGARISDETFVRRVHLDLIGHIPTADEVTAFLADTSPDKHSALIDKLLASPGYTNHWFNYWADLLRLNTENVGGNGRLAASAYSSYLRKSLDANKPYDQMVRELLGSDGKIWDQGAVGYYLRDPGMPLDNLSNTVQIFLGTRIVCAQCHDHPFDKWSQMDYYKMAAFTYGMQTNVQPDFSDKLRTFIREKAKAESEKDLAPLAADATKEQRRAYEQARQKAKNLAQNEVQRQEKRVVRAFDPITQNLRALETRQSDKLPTLPKDYKYADAKPGDAVHPVAMFQTPSVSLGEKASPLDAFTAWITAPENPRFTTVIANRLWKKIFGLGLIEPVDQFMDDTKPLHPELLAQLEKTLKDGKYDVKQYLRVLLNSDLYRRAATTKEIEPGMKYAFTGPLLRRMTAEQVWDSFLALMIPGLDNPASNRREARFERDLAKTRAIYEALQKQTPEQLITLADSLRTMQEENSARLENLRKELVVARNAKDKQLQNKIGQELNSLRNKLENGALAALSKASGVDFDAVAAAASASAIDGEGKDDPAAMMAMAPSEKQDLKAKKDYKNQLKEYVRASFLSSPAPRGHFLREFGQSDRETIENGTDEATVTQALSLLNGSMVDAISNRQSVLCQEVFSQADRAAKIDAVYLSVLNRRPDAAERTTIDELMTSRGEEKGLRDLLHALVNTRQFLYIQ